MKEIMKQREIKRYFKIIRKNLKFSCSHKKANQIIQSIKENAEEFFVEHPSASFVDFEENFGKAKDVSESILKTEILYDSNSLKTLQFKRKFFRVLSITIIFLALLIGGISVKVYFDINRSTPVYGEVEIREITDLEDLSK